MAKSRRRGFKSWFVEPYKQVRLGLIFLLINFAFAAMILGIFGYYVLDMYEAVSTYFRLSDGESQVALAKFKVPLIAGSALVIVFVVTTILASVRYTHAIYGPLVSIHRFLDELLTGHSATPIQLRESDQLKDLATKLNQLAELMTTDQRSGAMIAVHRYLNDLIEGRKPAPLKLRDGDHLTDLVEKLNQLGAVVTRSERA